MQTKLVIFDWDGTLADTLGGIVQNIEQAAQRVGLAPLPQAVIRDVIGLGWQEALQRLYPDIQSDQIEAMRLDYIKHQALQPKLVFFPGILALLDTLHARCDLAVATGKGRRGLDQSLEETGLGKLMLTTRTSDLTASKPNPLMLEEILDEAQLTPEQAVMVGDTHYDLEMALRIGMPSVGVTYGVHPSEVLSSYQPIAVVDDVQQLEQVLLARL